MTTSTLTRPDAPGRPPEDPDVDHLVCCDPDTAICGADVSDLPPPREGIPAGAELCELCLIAVENGLGCTSADCPA